MIAGRRLGRLANHAGFTLVELLASTVVLLVVASAVGGLAVAVQRGFDHGLASGELVARGRTGLMSLVAELRDAGSGVVIGSPALALAEVRPLVVPARSLTDPRQISPFTAVTIWRATGAQALLAENTPAGSMVVRLDPAAPSVHQDGTGGFATGELATIVDATRAEIVTVAAVASGLWTVTLAAPLRGPFATGAVIAGVSRTTFGLRSAAGGFQRLVRISSGGAEQPLADSVSGFEVSTWGVPGPLDPMPPGGLLPLTDSVLNDGPWLPGPADSDAFDADLLRIRRVDVRLRAAALPASRLRLPDLDLQTSVALRSR